MNVKRPILLVLLAAALGVGVARAAEIRTIGEKLEDDIVSIGTEGGRSVIKTARGKTIALEEVKHIRFDERAPAWASDANVVLLNKDELHGSIGSWAEKGESFKLKTSSLGEVDVKIENVAAIFFNAPAERERTLHAKYLDWLQKPGFDGRPGPDACYIRAGGKATGTISTISKDGIKIEADKIGTQTFALSALEAVVVGNAGGSGAATPAKGTLVRIRTADGSSISGVVARYAEGKLELTHALGTLTISSKDMLELFVLNGAFVYLSDLEPQKVEESFPEGFERDPNRYGWKRDREVDKGDRIRLGGRSYDKGLGVHTYCALTYNLGGGYREFRSVIGLDDSTKFWGTNPNDGQVTFRVLLGDAKKGTMKPAKELPEGKLMKRGDAPFELNINVEGVQTMTLVADYGNYLHVLGRADWADAHLVKR